MLIRERRWADIRYDLVGVMATLTVNDEGDVKALYPVDIPRHSPLVFEKVASVPCLLPIWITFEVGSRINLVCTLFTMLQFPKASHLWLMFDNHYM